MKLDENNQYGFAMIKPIPMGCINPVGHLFVVELSFNYEEAALRQRVYNEIYPSIIEKQKVIDLAERYVYQLMEQYTESDDRKPRSYCSTKNAHATLFQKRLQLLHLEHLSFLINRAGWKVMKLYSHYLLEQERFKSNFILINKISRQNAKNPIENHFCKLMNNISFGYDCRNKLDNCQFVPIFDVMNEVTYLKKYYNYFDKEVSKFVTRKEE